MRLSTMTKLSTLYETDYAAWAKRNAELLRSGHFAELDVEHLLQELGEKTFFPESVDWT